jgi:FAD:protein FMN transferase
VPTNRSDGYRRDDYLGGDYARDQREACLLGIDVLGVGSRQREFRAMGSDAHVVVLDPPAGVLEWACDEIGRLEKLWSRFLTDSDLNRCNRAAGTGPVRVHPLTMLAIQRALQLARATGGLFDPTILTTLEALGYDRPFRDFQPGDRGDLSGVGPAPTVAGIELDTDAFTVSLPIGARLDLGGVGKGLAADLIAEGAVDRGAMGAAVGMGGDVRIAGIGPDDGRWDIEVDDPRCPGTPFMTWALRHAPFDPSQPFDPEPVRVDSAIVTSTCALRSWTHAGERVHHVIDPATGRSANNGVRAVVVAAADAAWAEGFAKAVVIAGVHAGPTLLRDHRLNGWLFCDDGSVIAVIAPAPSHDRLGDKLAT